MENIIASIIVPVYNSEKTLKRCLDSLLKQTLKEIEIIVVDDGSTDESAKICDSYTDDRLKVIHQQNRGVSNARNSGLKVAKGNYIMFCDSDDWVEENFAEVYCKYMDETKVSLVVGGLILNDSTQQKSYKKCSDSSSLYFIEKKEFLKLRDLDLLAFPVNKIYLRDVVIEKGLQFKEDLSECEDLIFNLQYMRTCKNKIAIIPETLYHYEYHEGSLSSRYHNDRFFDVISPIFNNYEKAFKETGVEDKILLKDFYTIFFLKTIENIPLLWDKRNTFGFVKKLIKAQRIILSREYTVCLKNMDKSRFNKLFLFVYGSRFLPLILIFLRIYKK